MKYCVIIAAVCSAAWCGAVTRYVAPGGLHNAPYTNWADAATDIPSALAVAHDDDLILVTNGAYQLTETLAFTNATITLRSVNGAAATIIEGDGTFLIMYIARYCIIDGFTVRGGLSTGEAGGGMEIDDGIVRNCVITDCTAMFAGGAIAGDGGILEDSIVQGNTAQRAAGGVIAANGGIVRRCLIVDNHVTETGPASELYLGGGGAIVFFGGYIADCVISNNSSAKHGGGIGFMGTNIVERCYITDNTAAESGGGVYMDNGGILRSCVVRGNYAANGGGVACLTNGVVQNCTVVDNTATNAGGGLHTIAGGRSENSIIYFNHAPVSSNYAAQGSVTYRFSCALPLMSGAGCISNDPQFISFAGNLRLPSSSPCVDSGTNLPGLRLLTALDGNVRVSNGVDMGAYERSYPAPTLVITTMSVLVTYDVASLALAGTNSPGIHGDMRVRNQANNYQIGFARAGTAWSAPAVPLVVGTNLLSVTATNVDGFAVVEAFRVMRGAAGTGAPFVDITNDHMAVVYDVNHIFVAGTNNDNIVGMLVISNGANNFTGMFVPLSNWFSVHVPLEPNTNVIYVFGRNLAGDVSSDTMLVIRQLATGMPFVDITSGAAWVSHDVTSYAVAGTNNGQVAAAMWVSNATAGGVAQGFPAALTWTAPAVTLLEGTNLIVVYGSNLVNNVTNDSVVVVRGGWGTGAPFVDCTTAVSMIEYETSSFAFAGTNNLNVVGGMWISNQVNNAVQSFAAGASWQTPPVTLVVGLNDLWVYGTNRFGALAGELVLITRKGPATGPPFLEITSTNTAGTYDMASAVVQGTNNQYVVAAMWVSNAANHAVRYFSAALQWSTPPVPLNVGANVLWVFGQNAALSQVWDTVTFTRGQPGTGVPFIDITNGDSIVTFDSATFAAAGTNNPNVAAGGTMWVSNAFNGAAATFTAGAVWQAPPLPLGVGTNLFVVSGTNTYGAWASATALVWRQGPGSGVPFVDILPLWSGVGSEQNTINLDGTNNLNVVGGMWVSNSANGFVASFPAAAVWETPPVLLAAGTNLITVYGTNFVRQTATDTAQIMRADPGYGVPVVAITTTALNVTYDAASYALAGTNNINVVGSMWISNAANGALAVFPATAVWTAAAIPLAVGSNLVTVFGTNLTADLASDSRLVTRGPAGSGAPLTVITNDVTTVGPFVETYVLAGTNNANVVGGMWVSNDAQATVHSFPAQPSWASPPIALDRHVNILTVFATNALGQLSTDQLEVDRAVPVGVTNYVALDGGHVWPYLTWATASTNFADAVNEAPAGNLVMVGPGTNWLTSPLLLDRAVHVQSASGAAHTVIMVLLSQTASAFTLQDGALDGLTIIADPASAVPPDGGAVSLDNGGTLRNCSIAGFTVSNSGGGVYCIGGSVSNCVVLRNTAAWQGGGVFLAGGGTLRDSVVENNVAVQGGGALLTLHATVTACVFNNNLAVSSIPGLATQRASGRKANPGYGGAVCLVNGGVVEQCALIGNGARNGSAAAVFSAGTLRRSRISGNIAAYYAAVYCQYGGLVDACTITDNLALNSAGLMLDNGGTARNCVIGLNWAEDVGGANLIGNAVMENCTVCNNTADDTVGGIATSGNPLIKNSIIYHNTSGAHGDYFLQSGAPTFIACCASPAPSGIGNFADDPVLAHPQAGYFRLAFDSPCRDTGTNDLTWMASGTDISGRPRIVGPAVDVGAYEFTNEPVIWASARRLDFGEVIMGDAAAQALVFGNVGSELMAGQISGVTPPFGLNSGASYALAPLGVSTATFSFVPESVATFAVVVTLSGGDGAEVLLHGSAIPEPGLVLAAVLALLARARRRAA